MNYFKHSASSYNSISQNSHHSFAMSYSMMVYGSNALYSFIPKNACSTLRLSVGIENGCIESIEQGHWIHKNSGTFNASLSEAIKAEYTFVILRCPFKRLASVYLDKFVSKESDAWLYRETLRREINLDDLTFREFVLSLKKSEILYSNIHWRPQSDFLIYKEYSDYFSLEDFPQVISNLKEKIDFNIIDARELTMHGTHQYKAINDQCYADVPAFDISVMKRSGQCPSHESLYDKELFYLVSQIYGSDIELYKEKCNEKNMLSIYDMVSPILDINTVKSENVKYSFDVDFLRDEALRVESIDLKLAYKLMSLAHEARPHGPYIKDKYNEYKQQLEHITN